MKKGHEQAERLSPIYRWVRWSALLGLLSAIYLTWHYKLFIAGEGDQALCNVNQFINCDAVAASSWSRVFGVPLSVWGVGGYLALIIHTSWALRSRTPASCRLPTLMLILPFAAGLPVLPAVSLISIRSLCLGCAVSWIADIGLVVFGVKLLRNGSKIRWEFPIRPFLPAAALGGAVILSLAWFINASARTSVKEARAHIERAPSIPRFEELAAVDRLSPSFGDPRAPIAIVYFTDFQCPYCRLQSEALRELRERRPHDVRVIYRHYPLDASCNFRVNRIVHPFACVLAKLAIDAQRRNVFTEWSKEIWEAQESLTPDKIRQASLRYALNLAGVETDPEINDRLLKDILLADRSGVNSTPTLVINGKVFQGYMPIDRLEPLVSSLLGGGKP